jgi:hypothetical protein
MGLIELEFLTNHFENLVQVVVSAAPIPAPTFDILGADRLVASLSWPTVNLAAPTPGLEPPPGFVLTRASLRIGHASIAELTANPAAMTFTNATAWLFVGVSAAPHRLTADIVRIDIPGRPLSAPFSPPLPHAGQPTRLRLDLPLGLTAVGQAVLTADDVCTVRFVTTHDENLFAPPANRVKALNEGWAIHVSGSVIAEQLLSHLREARQKLPAGVTVETEPFASWHYGLVGLTTVGWGAFGGFAVEKKDACADVDISVDITASVILSADLDADTLTSRLQIASDASDWDSFRCWLAKGGLIAAVFLPPLAIDTLAAVGIRIEKESGGAIADNAPGGDWVKIGGTDSSATYENVSHGIPNAGPTSKIGGNPTIDAAGLVISGEFNPLPRAEHQEPHFTPNGGVIDGRWIGGFSCQRNEWSQSYELPYVEVVDQALVGPLPFARLPVKMFATSTVLPADLWSLEAVRGNFDETVRIVSHAAAADHQPTPPFLDPPVLNPKPSGLAFIHTTAGLKRFDLGPIPRSKTPPDEIHLIPMRVNCRNFGEEWFDPRLVVSWLVDPPELDFGHAALRQWQLTISEVPRATSIVVHGLRNGEVTEQLASVTMSKSGQVALEFVTDAETELAIDHTLREAPPGARMTQRWLIPTAIAEFDGTATGLVQHGDAVHVTGVDRLASLSMLTGQAVPAVDAQSPPFSLTLADGKVAAIHGNRLVIAVPHGGSAARSVTVPSVVRRVASSVAAYDET